MTANVLNWFGIIGGLGGLAALVKVLVDRTKVRSDAVDQIADTSVRMLAPLHDEIDRLSSKLRTAESELDDLRRQMRVLSDRHDEIERTKNQLASAERAVETLRTQIRGMYDELAEKDRVLAERDRLIADLRAGRQAS